MVHIGNSWDEKLKGEFDKEYYLKLREFLKAEYSSRVIYPNMYDIFNALKAVSYEDVKVVILGQDPYHEPGQAHGMCFSVKPGVPVPPSLQNMYKEIADEYPGWQIPADGYLQKWADQGVLLLNAVLTVRAHQANSHRGKGWEVFTDRVISLLDERQDPVIFLLWGRNAREKKALIRHPQHVLLEAAHPSPLSAYNGFFGCGHFRRANELLKSWGKEPIRW
ncbi:MAG: uracil-DNA glycosylase [Clostridia bacterium]|nr:uracil-DNA glycosylase [Clostridia bacterium]